MFYMYLKNNKRSVRNKIMFFVIIAITSVVLIFSRVYAASQLCLMLQITMFSRYFNQHLI